MESYLAHITKPRSRKLNEIPLLKGVLINIRIDKFDGDVDLSGTKVLKLNMDYDMRFSLGLDKFATMSKPPTATLGIS
jgi:hypothetical protein